MVDQVKSRSRRTVPAEQSRYGAILLNRHIQLIAIGGAIGTGLFMGSWVKRSSFAGPLDAFVYMIIGFMLFRDARHGELCFRI